MTSTQTAANPHSQAHSQSHSQSAAPAPNLTDRARVGIIMGSDSDLAVMQAAADLLAEFAIPFELTIVSAHRTPRRLFDYAASASERGLEVIIAGAGGAAHLPGMTAALTPLPVIGVPVKSAALSGQDSLLSIVQMPAGVPVATVAINGARNAGLLAAKMLGIADRGIRAQVEQFAERMERQVLEKASRLETGAHDSARTSSS